MKKDEIIEVLLRAGYQFRSDGGYYKKKDSRYLRVLFDKRHVIVDTEMLLRQPKGAKNLVKQEWLGLGSATYPNVRWDHCQPPRLRVGAALIGHAG